MLIGDLNLAVCTQRRSHSRSQLMLTTLLLSSANNIIEERITSTVMSHLKTAIIYMFYFLALINFRVMFKTLSSASVHLFHIPTTDWAKSIRNCTTIRFSISVTFDTFWFVAENVRTDIYTSHKTKQSSKRFHLILFVKTKTALPPKEKGFRSLLVKRIYKSNSKYLKKKKKNKHSS